MGETNFERMKNTSRLKELTGKDLVSIEYKNKNPFDAINYAKIVIATNSLPESHDKTDGFYRRWVIIDFKNRFSEERDILSEIPDQEYNNLSRKCIRVLRELLQRRTFTNEGTIEQRKERYEERSNPLTTFLKQYEVDVDNKIPASDFYDDFSVYLRNNGLRALTYSVVRGMMKDAGYEYERHRIPFRDNAVSCIVGLKRSDNTKDVVSAVSAVSVVLPSLYLHETQGESANTTDTLTQKKSTYELLCELFKGHKGVVLPIEIVQKKVASATEEWIEEAKRLGKIAELPAGYISIV